jgi:tRNA A-37 threonylcarbamoyl transferase component Bud32
MALEAGTRLGSYEIVASLGAGGMGEVYRARDTKLGREVAIKLLREEVSADPDLLGRFEREARVLASLNHPNIATLHGFESEGATGFLVMELVEGETLADRLSRGPIPVAEAMRLFLQVADGLEAAHRQGVVHRDLKPGNIKVSGEGQVKILDFGLAKPMVAGAASAGSDSLARTMPATATRHGQLLGTLSYMSPEQARGLPVDKQSDIWAFGACLYEVLSGRPAFAGDTASDTLVAILEREPHWPALPADTPAAVRLVLRRCLEKSVRERLHDIGDARLELRDAAASSTADAGAVAARAGSRRPGRALIAGAAIVLIAILAVAAWKLQSAGAAAPGGGPPVVVLMDTPAPAGVYDEETRRESGTNADDLSHVLGDLPVVLHKETVGATWDRENQVLRQRPDLIVIHRSSFFHSLNTEFGFGYPPPLDELVEVTIPSPEAVLEEQRIRLYGLADDKLGAFFGYVGLGEPATKFLVYSRGQGAEWSKAEYRRAWVADLERRFPSLQGRVFTMDVPVGPDGASFRDAATAELARRHVRSLLGLAGPQGPAAADGVGPGGR